MKSREYLSSYKFIIFFVFLLSFAFASNGSNDWKILTALAVLAAFFILIAIFISGKIIQNPQLEFIAREEMTQLFFSLLLISGFVIAQGFLDALFGYFGGTQNGLQEAQNIVSSHLSDLYDKIDDVHKVIVDYSEEGSRSEMCQAWLTGISISACGDYRPFVDVYTSVSAPLSIAALELESLKRFLEIGSSWAFTLLIPLGIFLRSFKFTRGAGSSLLAIGFSFYLFLPLSVLVFDRVIENFGFSHESHIYPEDDGGYTKGYSGTWEPGCDPDEIYAVSPYDAVTLSFKSLEAAAFVTAALTSGAKSGPGNIAYWIAVPAYAGLIGSETAFQATTDTCSLGYERIQHLNSDLITLDKIYTILYYVFIIGTFLPVFALFLFLNGIRFLGRITGVEIDVSLLGRLR